jgi:hypothetical protein
METLRNGDCHIVHREYVAEVLAQASSPSTYQVSQFPINPGQSQLFQWLSNIAQNFESYRFRKLRFCYETEAPSSLGGSLILAIDYDASDAAPLSKQQMLAYRGSVRSAPWTECEHSSIGEDLNKQKSYYVRPGVQPAGTDIKMYDVGNLWVATQGVTTGGATCGELYVEYDVLLMTPVYEQDPSSDTITMTAATTATPLTGGIHLGQYISSFTAAGVVTLQGLDVGAEYFVTLQSTGSVSFTCTFTTLVGFNAKSAQLNVDNVAAGATFIATNSVGNFTVVPAGMTATNAILVFCRIPVSVL